MFSAFAACGILGVTRRLILTHLLRAEARRPAGERGRDRAAPQDDRHATRRDQPHLPRTGLRADSPRR